jgi:hypothetical protein
MKRKNDRLRIVIMFGRLADTDPADVIIVGSMSACVSGNYIGRWVIEAIKRHHKHKR